MLDPGYCRKRQQRLAKRLKDRGLDAAVCGWPQHVYYLSGHWTHWLQQSAVVLRADGRMVLVSANEPDRGAAADDVIAYEANWMGTQRPDQPAVVAEHVRRVLNEQRIMRVGIDASAVTAAVAAGMGTAVTIDEDLGQLRRCKDPDELELMRVAVRCCEAMYKLAAEIIEPGVPELEVFTQLQRAAVMAAGEPLTALLGNDYACGVAGGPARKDRRAAAGELYILDLGPAFRGYFSDNARTFSVDRRPTGEQMKGWEAVVEVHRIVERMARPGVRCREIFAAVDEHLKQACGTGMPHHLGHGVGLQPHEYPHLNPKWDEVLVEGEVFTAEPGQYGPGLRGGIRIENQYLVTKDGVRNMLEYPMGLV